MVNPRDIAGEHRKRRRRLYVCSFLWHRLHVSLLTVQLYSDILMNYMMSLADACLMKFGYYEDCYCLTDMQLVLTVVPCAGG